MGVTREVEVAFASEGGGSWVVVWADYWRFGKAGLVGGRNEGGRGHL